MRFATETRLALLGFPLFSQRVPAHYSGHRYLHSIRSCSQFLLGGWCFRLSLHRTPGTCMIGSICVGVVGCSTGCILMGPVLSDCGVLLGMTINAQPAIFVRRRRPSDPGRRLATCRRAAGGVGRRRLNLLAFGRAFGPSPPRPPAASKGIGASRYRSLRQAAFDRAGCSHRGRTFPFFRLSVQVATGETFARGRAFLDIGR